MHRHFVCSDCHLKWFVRADAPHEDDPTHCARCDGRLVPLHTAPVIPLPERPRQTAKAEVPPADRLIA